MIEIPPKIRQCVREIRVGRNVFGGGDFVWIAGPCAVEDGESFRRIVGELGKLGVTFCRGGLFKPRSSPYAFQGLRAEGVELVRRAKEEFHFSFVTEVLDEASLRVLLPVTDMIQIGSRNCLNYELLKLAGATGKVVLLKRGFAVTMAEFLGAAEYLAASGAREIILCERGIRTVTEVTRFTLDVGAIAWLKRHVPCPVIADPSHAAGDAELVAPLLLAAHAAGADGAIVEVSQCPEETRCDAKQQLDLAAFAQMKRQMD
ncbi:MAG: 3-deoxy-7-phosphoheptulonate synthase [Victivallaceae bacterium]|nr:3-deoxy-7-phosphoheptulonate synthase [Victivallaceae bacterium]